MWSAQRGVRESRLFKRVTHVRAFASPTIPKPIPGQDIGTPTLQGLSMAQAPYLTSLSVSVPLS